MAINLAKEYSPLLDKRFTQQSLTEAHCGHDYSFDGVNAINVWTIGEGTINDYNAAASSNRFGTPSEIQDELNTYTLAKKRSFAHTLDITNVQDQKNIKRANAVMKQIWDEQLVPEIDKYRLQTWANGAGITQVGSAATSKSNIIENILKAGAAMNNHLVARDNRVCFVSESVGVHTKLASELQYNEAFTTKAIVNGQIARLNGMPIVAVPDDYMPAGVDFMIKWKRASADPMKLRMLRANNNAPGIAGTLIEGLVRYDSFVLAQKAYGIYVFAAYGNSTVCATPTAVIDSTASTKFDLASTTASSTIYYTTDGSNPKTSSTRQAYSAAVSFSSDKSKVIRAYATKSGMTDSGILTIKESDIPSGS